ncbi:MAG: hypothetical protein KKC39_06535 [Candidatus Omnitrophica bacterium]|nr:hypothetical protein [Candidatus Omnitrophota bacterium]MBU4468375.1 hypothetical protein [Candidatus Omnitrophota bacterium]MCG2707942.1 hypothetical protein [Candidatus Omnitrophota bacterium]
MLRRLRYLTIFLLIFLFFQFYKFVRIRITSLDLPKGKIVFSSQIDGDNEIYTMNINGSDFKQLTKNSATKISINIAIDEEPSFSPDGKKVVFASGRQGPENRRILTDIKGKPIGQEFSGGTSDIYIMDADSRNQTPLTYNTLSSHPFFAPDARKIVFDSLLADNHNLKKMIDIDGSGERILNFGGGQVEFSSDGKKMFDNFQYDISIVDIGGTNRKKLTHFNDYKQTKLGIKFAISPDNKKLTVITSETGKMYRPDNIDDFYDIFEFYAMNIDGSNLEKIYRIDGSISDRFCGNDVLKSRIGHIWQFKFSPDGKYIIFYAGFIYKQGIYLLNLENRSVINLTGEKENWDEILDFTFTPDGKRIVFIADIYPKNYYLHAVILRNIKAYINYLLFWRSTPYYDNKYICIMDIDGKNFRKITKLPIGAELGRDFIHWEK